MTHFRPISTSIVDIACGRSPVSRHRLTEIYRKLYNATTKEYTWPRSGYLYSLLLLLDIIMLSRRGSLFNVLLIIVSTGWPKKVSHYRESSLNRIKNRQPG